jgi:glycine/D-amino acid oxidase-like deaminating enzyme
MNRAASLPSDDEIAALDAEIRVGVLRARQLRVQSEAEATALFEKYRSGLLDLAVQVAISQCEDDGSTWSKRVLDELDRQGRLPAEIDRRFIGSLWKRHEGLFEPFGKVDASNPDRNYHPGRLNEQWRLKRDTT